MPRNLAIRQELMSECINLTLTQLLQVSPTYHLGIHYRGLSSGQLLLESRVLYKTNESTIPMRSSADILANSRVLSLNSSRSSLAGGANPFGCLVETHRIDCEAAICVLALDLNTAPPMRAQDLNNTGGMMSVVEKSKVLPSPLLRGNSSRPSVNVG